MKQVYLDFEFNQASEPTLNLVSCALDVFESGQLVESQDHWLYQSSWDKLRKYLEELPDGTEMIAYNVEAEARCLLDLGIDPFKFKWIDLYLEFKMLCNHNWELEYGESLVDGEVKKLIPFVNKRCKQGLSQAIFKFLNVIIDTKEKDEVRELIISDDAEKIIAAKERIMTYGRSDIQHLPNLRKKMAMYIAMKLKPELLKTYKSEAYLRGEYACRSAKMVKDGYPINIDWARNLSDAVTELFYETIKDINAQFPRIKPFYFNKKENKWSMSQVRIREWIKEQKFPDWELTDGGKSGIKQLSLGLDAWLKYFPFTHEYPRDNFGAQMVRFLKLKQSLNGMVNKAGDDEKSFWDYVGSDGRVRPYFNIYGAQSSRTQPASTGFIFLKPAWQRSIVQPPPGKCIIALDYSSEEFLLSAITYKDRKMVEAYKSGDVYLYFAKDIGLVPRDGTKDKYSFERDLCKGTVLGISYLMSKIGLSRKLTSDTGKFVSEEDAQYYIDSFDQSFIDFSTGREDAIQSYYVDGYVKLPCGWYMFGDNQNHRSVGNVPIQGVGGSVLRRAVKNAQDRKLKVLFTLHDAVYIEADTADSQRSLEFLASAMSEAFCHYFEGEQKEWAKLIRLDGKVWGPDFQEETLAHTSPSGIPYTTSRIHIDKRAKKEFDVYSKYMIEPSNYDLL